MNRLEGVFSHTFSHALRGGGGGEEGGGRERE